MEAIGHIVPLPTMYAGETLRAIAGTTFTVSSDKAKRELGFAPRPIDVGMRETVIYEARRLGLTQIAERVTNGASV